MLKLGYHLVIVMLGGNDISAETNVREFSAKLFESYGATCIMCTIEKRDYTPTIQII